MLRSATMLIDPIARNEPFDPTLIGQLLQSGVRDSSQMKAQARPAAGITIGELKTEIDDLPDDAIVVAIGREGESHPVFGLMRATGHDPDHVETVSLLVAFGVVPPERQ